MRDPDTKYIFIFLTLLLAAVMVLMPWVAQAAAGPVPVPVPIADPGRPVVIANGVICPAGTGIASRIIPCIQGIIIWAVTAFLLPISEILSHVVAACCVLAVAFYGINVMLARKQPRIFADGFMLVVKVALVLTFTWNFGGMFPWIIAVIDDVLNTVSSYVVFSMSLRCPYSIGIWERVDCALDQLIGGVLPGTTMAAGFLGFLMGCIFSGTTGLSIFLVGLGFFLTILMAIFKAIYIYLSALIGISLLVLGSPLILPTALFRVTKPYFDKWLRLLLGLMLQPIFLFAYLSLLLAAFDVVVYSGPKSLFVTIAGADALNQNFRIGNFMIQNGAYVERKELDLSLNLNSREMAEGLGLPGLEQTGMFGKMGDWANDLSRRVEIMMNKNIGSNVPVQAVDMCRLAAIQGYVVPPCKDPDTGVVAPGYTTYVIRVTMSLLMTAVVAYIFYIMLQVVPYLGTTLSGEVLSMPNLGATFDKQLGGLKSKLAPEPPGMQKMPEPAAIPKPAGRGG